MEAKQENLFPDIGDPDEVMEDVEDTESDNDEVDIDPSQEEIRALKERLDKKDEETARLTDQLLQVASRPAEQQRVDPPQADEKLPELLEDPEGYAAALERNLQRNLEAQMAQTKAQSDQNARYDKLTNRFQVKEPELAKENWDVVEFIVTKKVREAAANGISVDSLVFANQDKFIDDVARDVRAMVGSKPEEDDNTATQDLPSAGGISRRAPKKKVEKKAKSFLESMKEIRRLTPGFYSPASAGK